MAASGRIQPEVRLGRPGGGARDRRAGRAAEFRQAGEREGRLSPSDSPLWSAPAMLSIAIYRLSYGALYALQYGFARCSACADGAQALIRT